MEELVTYARRRTTRTNPEGTLRGFLQEVALVSDVDGLDDADGPQGDA